jgi:hypothetical protein
MSIRFPCARSWACIVAMPAARRQQQAEAIDFV